VKLFISYPRDKRDLIEEISRVLESGGHDPWYDKALTPGRNWEKELGQRIDQADIFIYALTPKSVESKYCQWEFAHAKKRRKPVLPVLIHEHFLLPRELDNLHYVNFKTGPTPENTAQLLNGLQKAGLIRVRRRWRTFSVALITLLIIALAGLLLLSILTNDDGIKRLPLNATILSANLMNCTPPLNFTDSLIESLGGVNDETAIVNVQSDDEIVDLSTAQQRGNDATAAMVVWGECTGGNIHLNIIFPTPFYELLFEPTVRFEGSEVEARSLILASVYYVSGEYEKAKTNLDLLVDRNSDNEVDSNTSVMLIWLRANIALRDERWTEAKVDYEIARGQTNGDMTIEAQIEANIGLSLERWAAHNYLVCKDNNPTLHYRTSITLLQHNSTDDLMKYVQIGLVAAQLRCHEWTDLTPEIRDELIANLQPSIDAAIALAYSLQAKILLEQTGQDRFGAYTAACSALASDEHQSLAHLMLGRIYMEYDDTQRQAAVEFRLAGQTSVFNSQLEEAVTNDERLSLFGDGIGDVPENLRTCP